MCEVNLYLPPQNSDQYSQCLTGEYVYTVCSDCDAVCSHFVLMSLSELRLQCCCRQRKVTLGLSMSCLHSFGHAASHILYFSPSGRKEVPE